MKKEEEEKNMKTKRHFWRWAIASVIFRLILIYFPKNLNLATRPEVSTPVTSLRRLAEGYWLTQSSMSPYAGSMYHGSPLLLSVLGPLTMKKIEGQPYHLLCSCHYIDQMWRGVQECMEMEGWWSNLWHWACLVQVTSPMCLTSYCIGAGDLVYTQRIGHKKKRWKGDEHYLILLYNQLNKSIHWNTQTLSRRSKQE